MKTFKKEKKHGFDFKFDIDDNEYIETIYIDMTDQKLPQRMMNAQNIINKRIDELKIDDIELKSDGIPEKIETFEDVAALSDEQLEDIKNVSDVIFKVYDDSEKILIDEIGNALNTDVSAAFKHISAFDVIDGEYYVSMFLEALADDMVAYLKAHPQKEVNFDKKPYMRKYLKR